MYKAVLADAGLTGYRPFFRDIQFLLALLVGVFVWFEMWFLSSNLLPVFLVQNSFIFFLSVVLWQPFLEELLFRGVVQGQFRLHNWGKEKRWGITRANLFASLLFVLVHFIYHSPLWAIAVFFPSLVFGYFRDKYGSIYAALALHVFYNAGYFLLGLLKMV
ncbi:JDVT-CTERM system glutamic-type intramembrane protease MrtJ [Sulfurirhabdus autotrophica]|uniref:CAAX prenyl protease 2/Lysostaphin resistance protein A-like domain-containing protein n=1 Tax=Sulfurirhabdus autotrophica TaxID=1706046 RepID=A0A4V2W1A7_9PROT|nr:JDVT-CTERM system glutamic-type intramembrane protease [Sulfurirhabdus autotrophica]TCV83409.1 hypothetical protein EDC63_11534 [Sulfurirhabdus autotrophica]